MKIGEFEASLSQRIEGKDIYFSLTIMKCGWFSIGSLSQRIEGKDIYFSLTIMKCGWFSIGFGDSMNNLDLIVFIGK